MVESFVEKTTAEVLNTLGQGRPLLDRLEALGACCPDDLDALFGHLPSLTRKPIESTNLSPFPTAA